MRTCTVSGCTRTHIAKGLCHTHYERRRSTGSVNAEKPFKLRRPEHKGLRKHPMYDVWDCMLRRCLDPEDICYKNYGGRGITVCDRWMDLRNFISDMSPRPDGYSLDRINNDGNYEPSNCQWASERQQSNNRRTNRRLTLNDETMTITEWSKKIGISAETIAKRIDKYGWPIEKALTTAVKP